MALKSLNNLSPVDYDEIRKNISEGSFFFTGSFEIIAKHFLSNFIEGNLFQLSFNEIRSKFIEQAWEPAQAPKSELEFYQSICLEYLGIQSLPSISLIKLYKQASEDLKATSDNINKYQQHLQEQNEDKDENESYSYGYRLHKHYIDLNTKGRSQIIEFISSSIEEYARFDCMKQSRFDIAFLYNRVPYDYRLNPPRYEVNYLSDMSNKFLDLGRVQRAELDVLFNNDKLEFYKQTKRYITENKIVEKIEEMIRTNHVLDNRNKVFVEVLNAYKQTNKHLFCYVIPLQIEGLFYDYCLELGIEEKSVRNASITAKMDQIIRKTAYAQYEYYAFRFPLIRNDMAHGKLIAQDIDNLADYLILDFFEVCKLVTSNTLLVNKTVMLINVIKDNLNDFKGLIRYCLFRDVKIPSFYNLEEDVLLIKEKIFQQEFWDYLNLLISKGSDILKRGVLKIVIELEKASVNEAWCHSIIQSLPNIVASEFNENDFLDELSNFGASL